LRTEQWLSLQISHTWPADPHSPSRLRPASLRSAPALLPAGTPIPPLRCFFLFFFFLALP
jgi:hypothetical protein